MKKAFLAVFALVLLLPIPCATANVLYRFFGTCTEFQENVGATVLPFQSCADVSDPTITIDTVLRSSYVAGTPITPADIVSVLYQDNLPTFTQDLVCDPNSGICNLVLVSHPGHFEQDWSFPPFVSVDDTAHGSLPDLGLFINHPYGQLQFGDGVFSQSCCDLGRFHIVYGAGVIRVPEPASLLLVAAGLALLIHRGRRRHTAI